jgi:hypothetical protein
VSTNALPDTSPPTRRVLKADRGDLPRKGGGENHSSLPAERRAGGGLTWLEAIRAGRTVVTAGPLLTLAQSGNRFRASSRLYGAASHVELVANGQTIASGEGEAEAIVSELGWVAARCSRGEFAHTSPVRVGSPLRKPEAVAVLRKLIDQTREWADTHGRFTNPKRKQAILDHCAEAIAKLEGPA